MSVTKVADTTISRYQIAVRAVLGLLLPFAVLITSISKLERGNYRWLLVFFAFFLGFSFLTAPGTDGFRNAEIFRYIGTLDTQTYLGELKSRADQRFQNPDYYLPTISFLISRFTENSRIYFAIISTIYFSVFLSLFAHLKKMVLSGNGFRIFLYGGMLLYPFSAGINSIRFPFALIVFSYFVLMFIFRGKNHYIFLSLLSILIHWAFIVVVPIVIFFAIFRKMKNGFWYILIISGVTFLTLNLSFQNLGNSLFVDSSVESKYNTYSSGYYVTGRTEHFNALNIQIQLANLLPFYFALTFVLLSRMSNKVVQNNYSRQLGTIALLLLLMSFASSLTIDPISNRFAKVGVFFSLLYLFYLSSINHKVWVLLFARVTYIPILVIQVYLIVRTDLEVFTWHTFLGNYLTVLADDSPVALITTLKNLF